ncbi:MAB family class A beta-lactamase [Brevundimonas basaltis]|uniref:beta-lactamase n=1 Tax=Brevundimonas basaltis TaxID=472166 RepID=A0A7W8MGU6_9CAUL|nr:class A beta-lactamase [Brevundimonas basaltis]MBB5292588.1 beta-lactamase class A [Brevundimonas basaltis]
MIRADRRSVLTGMGALALAGCDLAPASPVSEVRQTPGAWEVDLSALEAADGGRIGLQASDWNMAFWRAHERFNYCSTFKTFLATATLERVQRGEERLDRAIPITAADMVSHAPVTEPAIGSTLTIEQLCKGTVEISDNPAANILIRELGGIDAFRAWYRSIGDQSTTVDRLEPMMNRKDGDKDTITPSQAVANLGRVFGAGVMEPRLEEPMLTRLRRWMIDSPTGANRIKGGVPSGWTVAHKTGTGGTGQTNDIGVINPPSGDPIHIAIYYDAPSDLSASRRDAVIAEATRLALKTLGRA